MRQIVEAQIDRVKVKNALLLTWSLMGTLNKKF